MGRSRRLPEHIEKKLAFLLSSQYWPEEKLVELQLEKLLKLIRHAYRTVPYYTRLLNKWGIDVHAAQDFSDLKKIPSLSKKDIRTHFTDLLSASADKSGLYLEHSGGATGEPVKCYQDGNYLHWAAAARIRAWKYFPGFTEHEREALLWGADRDITNTLKTGQVLNILFRQHDICLNTFNATESRFRKFVLLCNLVKPAILRGYASSLVEFSHFLNSHCLTVHPPGTIITSAESLTPSARNVIEQTVEAPVLDSYGCREVSFIAMECKHQSGYHIAMENNYVEIQDGKILVTNLNNYAMPLLRYEIEDCADGFMSGTCPCGRGLKRITRLRGRQSDTLHFGGTSVHAEYITHLLYTETDISRFQIVKNEKQNRLKILLDKKDQNVENLLLRSLNSKFPGTAVEILVTDTFIKTETGKHCLVVDESTYRC